MRSIIDKALLRVAPLANRTAVVNARPYDPATPMHPPTERWPLTHYGVMIAGLPAPVNFFDIISIQGTAHRIRAYAAPSLVQTSARDSAWLLVGSAVSRDNFRPFSLAADCDLSDDGTDLRFSDRVRIEHGEDAITVHARTPGLAAELTLRPTDQVSHFAHLPGIYDHWSRLCEYEGSFTPDGGRTIRSSGLCTWEYARGRDDVPLPIHLFTYQVVNVTPRVQVLMTELTGPFDLPLQRTVYVRDLDDVAATYTRQFTNVVVAELPRHETPDGFSMRLPHQFTWSVADDDGREVIRIDGTSNDDFAYGMAGGYAGSFDYTGRFRGRAIDGRGYIEWIDRRHEVHSARRSVGAP